MSLLFETLRIENGIIMHPEDHEARMLRSRTALFGLADPISLQKEIKIPQKYSSGIIRCRVDYGIRIESVNFTSYQIKPLRNFRIVRNKLKEIEEKDALRNFQPPIDGSEIIMTFDIQPGKMVGIIKNAIRDAILDGIIPNEHDAARKLMLEKGVELGLNPVEHVV